MTLQHVVLTTSFFWTTCYKNQLYEIFLWPYTLDFSLHVIHIRLGSALIRQSIYAFALHIISSGLSDTNGLLHHARFNRIALLSGYMLLENDFTKYDTDDKIYFRPYVICIRPHNMFSTAYYIFYIKVFYVVLTKWYNS